ncbi:unnamed protein product [Arabidopsis thaliana]|uniref:Peptidase C1A papain C-terminal domain-containing protein n=1 Tax=Arabidopsis thaliana TaxID=3702 RepID=A0A654FPL4_ARATH|nr:unnamed protein product [Arabidopsis thaliana]
MFEIKCLGTGKAHGVEVVDPPPRWVWSGYAGIVSNVLNQKDDPNCWAISFIRAIEAIFNIGKRLDEQRSFFIQHLANNVKIRKYELEDTSTLADFVDQNGILEEGECLYTGTSKTL